LPAELRQIFNNGEYYERVLRGDLFAVTEKSRLADPRKGQPPGTTSETVVYFDLQMNRVAFVHQYVLPDGTLGGSGRPDPKRILLDDVILFC